MGIPFREFEPGSVTCERCKNKPDDGWTESPEGFTYFPQWNFWFCDDCKEQSVDDIECGPRDA